MKNLIVLSLFFLFVCPLQTFAYLDPGTGSYITQILIASVIGVGYVFRSRLSMIKDMIMGMFSGKKKEKKEEKTEK